VAAATACSVNADVPGAYTLADTARDPAHHAATVIHPVNVVDTSAPTLTLQPANIGKSHNLFS
jgi:hypothetical protein